MWNRSLPWIVAVAPLWSSMAGAQPAAGVGYLEMDGVNDSATARGDFLTQSLTVEAWVRPTSVHPLYTAGIVTYGAPLIGAFDFGIGPETDPRLKFFINYGQGQKTVAGTQPVDLGVWQHLAVTYDGEIARLYINGQLDAEKPLAGPILSAGPDALLAIGDDYPGASEYIGGSFDEVRLWNVVRTQEEIDEFMFTPLQGDEPGLMAYYDFDECAGQAVFDRSPNARHAALGGSLSRGDDDPQRKVYEPSRRRCLELNSSAPGEVRLVVGTLPEQLAQINAGPPALGWTEIVNRHADLHVRDAFACDPDLGLPYVDTETFLVAADEVTLDNCASAFYRFLVAMPPEVRNTSVFGVANTDDLGVAFVNGRAVSPPLTEDDAANLGADRMVDGHPVLGWPTADPFFETEVADLVLGGVNELAFGVCSDASEFEPGGLEFEMVVQYDCLADGDADGDRDTIDFTAYLNDWAARQPEADLNEDGVVNTLDVLVWLNTWSFGCPG